MILPYPALCRMCFIILEKQTLMPYWFRRGHVDISTERFHVSSRLSTLFICHIAHANSHVLIIVRTQDFLLDSLWCFSGFASIRFIYKLPALHKCLHGWGKLGMFYSKSKLSMLANPFVFKQEHINYLLLYTCIPK